MKFIDCIDGREIPFNRPFRRIHGSTILITKKDFGIFSLSITVKIWAYPDKGYDIVDMIMPIWYFRHSLPFRSVVIPD